ncbi:MAG: GxxExxY protein [Chloroflexi bacterium]|nr:GxxExxY protein [Chloroflexota bacterium]
MSKYHEIKHKTLTHEIIGAAIDVHRSLGPGLLEQLYEDALCIELTERQLKFEQQKAVEVTYRGHTIGSYRLDLVVEDIVVLELKSVKEILPVHKAQLLSYLRITESPIGLLINFNVAVLRNGIKRLVL